MVRSFLPRFPLLRSIIPRVSAPILPTSRTRITTSPLTHTPRASSSRFFHHFPGKLESPPSPRTPTPDPRYSLPPDATFSQRLKHLIKSYGWYALGVYFMLSTIDLGIAFAGVNLLGAEYMSGVANAVKNTVTNVLHSKPLEPGKDEMESMNPSSAPGHEGMYAMLVLAYTIHKTLFLPVRVGLTAALTPRLVGWLSRRGWAGGAGTRRAATEMRERIQERRSRGNRD